MPNTDGITYYSRKDIDPKKTEESVSIEECFHSQQTNLRKKAAL